MKVREYRLASQEVRLLLGVLLMGILLRLINIIQPFVDKWCWRQADMAMIAENFYRHGFNIFYPQINWAGNVPGYVGTEFPLVPFLASLVYLLFGVQDWIGRAVSVLFFAVSVPFLYLLVRKISNERSGIFATVIYILAPLSIFASRSFMSDMASLSLSIVALYLSAEWLERPTDARLFAAATAATALAILVKLPAMIIGVPLLYMAWQTHGLRLVRRPELWAFAALSLLPALAWYSHAHLVSIQHTPHHMFGEGGVGMVPLANYMNLLRRAAKVSLTFPVAAGMLVGIVLPRSGRFGYVFHWWLLAIIAFIVLAGKGSEHEWYHLPVVPVAAAFAGLGCEFLLRRIAQLVGRRATLVAGVAGLATVAYLSYLHTQPMYRPWQMPSWRAGTELNRIAPPGALVIVADDCDPTAIYYSRRKGWHFLDKNGFCHGTPAGSRQAIENLEKLRSQGANYLVFTKDTRWWLKEYRKFQEHLDSRYERVTQTKDYVVFALSPRSAQ